MRIFWARRLPGQLSPFLRSAHAPLLSILAPSVTELLLFSCWHISEMANPLHSPPARSAGSSGQRGGSQLLLVLFWQQSSCVCRDPLLLWLGSGRDEWHKGPFRKKFLPTWKHQVVFPLPIQAVQFLAVLCIFHEKLINPQSCILFCSKNYHGFFFFF